jgi:4-methyl-5(b-hydroxyethyl)-thiazole monophosphate biosynthesis
MKRVLCVLENGVEETELVAPVDVLRRAEIDVVMASFSGELEVTGKQGIVLKADELIYEVDAGSFDALFLPGGPAVMSLRADGRATELAKQFAAEGKLVAAICAAPLLLKDAGLLEGRRYTAHDSVWGELTEALGDERVVVDGNIITSRGPGTALDFGLKMVEVLAGEEAAKTVAAEVML